MVSIASTDVDEDEDRDEDSANQEDKEGKTLSFVVPTLPSPPSHSTSYTQHQSPQHLSPFDAIATQLSSSQQQIGGNGNGGHGAQVYNRPAYHGRSASAPTPPPFNTLSPLLQQHQQHQQQYQSFPQDPATYTQYNATNQYANTQQGYAQQQAYGQQWFGYGQIGQMGQQHIQIPNVYNTPNANSCPTSPSPNNTTNTGNVGGMNMLPTSPTTDVPMISGARRGSAPGHSATTAEAFEVRSPIIYYLRSVRVYLCAYTNIRLLVY